MKDLITSLKELYDSEISLIEIPVISSTRIGTEISLRLSSGEMIASGCGTNKDIAMRICIAEAFERGLAMKISQEPDLRNSFKIHEYPTTCGFAAGFDKEKTKLRAIAEGLERWAWSKWIDHNCALNETSLNLKGLTSLGHFFVAQFQDFKCYEKIFSLSLDNIEFRLKLIIFLGFTNDGIFPGSRVTMSGDEYGNWDHAILEAYRCLKNFKLSNKTNLFPEDLIARRANYFGEHKKIALSQIEISQNRNESWSQPRISLLKEYKSLNVQIYLWRCLFDDYIGWHVGKEDRFVY